MSVSVSAAPAVSPAPPAPRLTRRSPYPGWFFTPAAIVYSVLFLAPTFASLYFSLTRWTPVSYTHLTLPTIYSV